MPPLPVINDTFRCALNWQVPAASKNAVNVIHVSSNTVSSPTTVGELVRDAATAAMWGPVYSGAHVQSITVTPLDGVTASVDVDVSADTAWGGQTSGQYLDNVAALVKFTTAKRGRSYRGRLYMPFVAEGAIIDSVVQDLGPVQVGWDAFLDNLQTSDVDLVIASYLHATAQFVNNALVENVVATQRRRLHRP